MLDLGSPRTINFDQRDQSVKSTTKSDVSLTPTEPSGATLRKLQEDLDYRAEQERTRILSWDSISDAEPNLTTRNAWRLQATPFNKKREEQDQEKADESPNSGRNSTKK